MNMLSEQEKEILKERLSENMQMLRAKLGLSQSKLAEIMGVSRQTVNAVETGRQKMSWSLFISLILFFSYNKGTRELLPVVKLDMKKLEKYLSNKE